MLGTYLAFTGASSAEVGNFAQAFFASIHLSVDWLLLAIIAGVLIWIFAYSDIAGDAITPTPEVMTKANLAGSQLS